MSARRCLLVVVVLFYALVVALCLLAFMTSTVRVEGAPAPVYRERGPADPPDGMSLSWDGSEPSPLTLSKDGRYSWCRYVGVYRWEPATRTLWVREWFDGLAGRITSYEWHVVLDHEGRGRTVGEGSADGKLLRIYRP